MRGKMYENFWWWFCTITFTATGTYIVGFLIVVCPVVFFRWVTGKSPRYIPPPRETNAPPQA